MAYCILVAESNSLHVQDWGVLNLMDETEILQTCSCKLAQRKSAKMCTRKARYTKDDIYYCETHMKKSLKDNSWILRNKSNSPASIKKMTRDVLVETGLNLGIWDSTTAPATKKRCCEMILERLNNHGIQPIIFKKKKTAGEIDLITVGRNMKQCLDSLLDTDDITHVIMENQISTIASRMKTVQGMLAQYYIMLSNSPYIEFVSSANKLKHLVNIEANPKPVPNNYKQHKKDSVEFCAKFVATNPSLGNWANILQTSKKDDLADAFLQGIWYLKHTKLITYAENLKINSVSLS